MPIGMIPIKVPWTRQPPIGTGINKSHPAIRSGNLAFLRAGTLRELVTNSFPTTVGSAAQKVATDKGYTVDYNNTAPDEYDDIIFAGKTMVTAYCLVFPDSLTIGSNENRLIHRINTSGAQDGADWTLDIGDPGSPDFSVAEFVISLPSAADIASSATQITTGQWWMIAGRWVSGGKPQIYLEGELEGTGTNDITDTFTAGVKEIWVGGRSDGTDDVDGRMAFVAAFADYHSDALIRSISKNPWQLFEPRTIWIPVGLTATTQTITGTAGEVGSGEVFEIDGVIQAPGPATPPLYVRRHIGRYHG